jgi:acetoacetyl-CoA synthetase
MSSASNQTPEPAAQSAAEQAPLWQPSAADRERAEMTRFMRWAGVRHGREFEDYEDLWRWSVAELEDFWQDVWEFFGVRSSREHERVLGERSMPGAQWFAGARLNYAENMLRGPAHKDGRSCASCSS